MINIVIQFCVEAIYILILSEILFDPGQYTTDSRYVIDRVTNLYSISHSTVIYILSLIGIV